MLVQRSLAMYRIITESFSLKTIETGNNIKKEHGKLCRKKKKEKKTKEKEKRRKKRNNFFFEKKKMDNKVSMHRFKAKRDTTG